MNLVQTCVNFLDERYTVSSSLSRSILCFRDDVDVVKNAKGNASAGIRARKGLRALRDKLSELVKTTLNEEKSAKEDAVE